MKRVPAYAIVAGGAILVAVGYGSFRMFGSPASNRLAAPQAEGSAGQATPVQGPGAESGRPSAVPGSAPVGVAGNPAVPGQPPAAPLAPGVGAPGVGAPGAAATGVVAPGPPLAVPPGDRARDPAAQMKAAQERGRKADEKMKAQSEKMKADSRKRAERVAERRARNRGLAE